jgi:hypothetical protein
MGAQKNQQTSVRSYKRFFLHKKGLQEMLSTWSLNKHSPPTLCFVHRVDAKPAVFREGAFL